MRAPRNSALAISSRCCSPIGEGRDEARSDRAPGRTRARSPRGGRARRRGRCAAAAGHSDEEVLEHAQARREVEVLVDHADAGGERVGRAARSRPAALDEDAARVGAIGAEEDVHQGRLAGAVFAEEPDDLAGGARRESTPALARHVAEALRDAPHLDESCGLAHARRTRQSETGVASSTSTRKLPSRISAFFFSTRSFTSAGSFWSKAW